MLPAIQPPNDGETCFICGPVASGKTHLLKNWCKEFDRVAVFDPTGEFDMSAGFFEVWAEPKTAAKYLQDNPYAYKLAYHPLDTEEGFNWLTQAIWQQDLPRRFIAEEIHEIMSPHYQASGMKLISKYARKRMISFIGSSQRIADVSKDFTSACRMAVYFHTTEALDLAAIEDRYGTDFADQVTGLRPLQYDDVKKITRQTPEVLVWRRGMRPEKIQL